MRRGTGALGIGPEHAYWQRGIARIQGAGKDVGTRGGGYGYATRHSSACGSGRWWGVGGGAAGAEGECHGLPCRKGACGVALELGERAACAVGLLYTDRGAGATLGHRPVDHLEGGASLKEACLEVDRTTTREVAPCPLDVEYT